MTDFLNFLGQFIILCLVAIFVENAVFSRALGASRAIALAKRPRNILLYGIVLIFITLVSSVACWGFHTIFPKLNPAYIPICYIGIIAMVYLIIHLVISNIFKKHPISRLSNMLYFLPVATFNCAALGSIFLSIDNNYSLWQFISFGIGTGIGFIIATFLVVNGLQKINEKNPPKAFAGFPVMLIYIGILSLALYCLVGHQLPF